MADDADFDFSPSTCHRMLAASSAPRLRFDGGDVSAWQSRFRTQLVDLVGTFPDEHAELQVRHLWRRDHAFGQIQKLVFTSEAGADVPAYMCLPADATPPYRTMICLQGHTTGMHNSIGVTQDENDPMDVPGDRDFAIGCMRRGFAALCIEQRGFGERRERCIDADKPLPPTTCNDAAMQALLLGRTLVGERVWDVDRGIDYLHTRSDIALDNIGIMGNSTGGTVATYAAALLPRLRLAVPSCSFCTFETSWLHHHLCACGYVPRLFQYGRLADVLGMFAPQPVVVVSGRSDPLLPFDGAQQAVNDLCEIYRAAGAEDNCHFVVGPEGHRFYADQTWPVIEQAWSATAAP